jgi:hypothetical protein
MGWDGRRGQLTDPDAVAWQYLVVAVVTLWTVAIDTRIDDAEPQGVLPGRVRRASPPTGASPRWRAGRRGAVGDPPAPAGDAPTALGAGARALTGLFVVAPGAVAEKR